MPLNDSQTRASIPDYILNSLPGDFLNEYSWSPDTHNNLTNNKFQFFIGRCPRVSYFCQRVNLPSLSFGTSANSNPTGIISRRPGTAYTYDDLQVGFVIDENMSNWLEVHNWIVSLGIGYGNGTENLNEHQKISSAHLLILNSKYAPFIWVTFHNVYPTSISAIDFDSSLVDTDPVIAMATFSYTHYSVEVFTTTP